MNRLDRAGHKGRLAACWVGSLLPGVTDPSVCPKNGIYHGAPWTHVEIPYVFCISRPLFYHFMAIIIIVPHEHLPWSMAMIGLMDPYGCLILPTRPVGIGHNLDVVPTWRMVAHGGVALCGVSQWHPLGIWGGLAIFESVLASNPFFTHCMKLGIGLFG